MSEFQSPLNSKISIQAFDDLASVAKAFPGVFANEQGSEVFYSPQWFDVLGTHGNTFDGNPLFIVSHDHESGATLCLPTIDSVHLSGLSNYYASLYGPFGKPSEASSDTCIALCRWLRGQPKKWPLIDFHPLDTETPFYRNMLPALRRCGYWADSYTCFGNWYIDVSGMSYADYLAKRPSRLRNTIKRNLRKSHNAGETSITIHQNPGPELDRAIDHFSAIYEQSWKPAESHPAFIAELCRMSAKQGWLRLGVLSFNGEAIAAQIWLVCGGKANIFKLAYSEGKNPFSAGTLLTAELMRHSINVDHAEEVDYLTGDDAYKQDWMSHRRERRGIVAFKPTTLRGLVLGTKHVLGKFRQLLIRNAGK